MLRSPSSVRRFLLGGAGPADIAKADEHWNSTVALVEGAVIRGRAPARVMLGLDGEGAAAVVVDGRVCALQSGADVWTTATAALSLADVDIAGVEQLAVAEAPAPRPLAWWAHRRWARDASDGLGGGGGFRGQGRVGTRLPRVWDRRDRVTLHDPARCRAAAAYYTAGVRAALVAVQVQGEVRLWLGTSGKLVALPAAGSVPLSRTAHELGVGVVIVDQRLAAQGLPSDARTSTVSGPAARALGAALLAWADERQGAWVPALWSPS
jgi:hypothetical protein